jgi:phage terminase large subunit-like protein
MIEGDSGILACSPPHFRPEWKPGNQEVVWPNGTVAEVYGAENPDKLRGPQHHFAWADELAAWRFLQDTWDQIGYGLRLGVQQGIHPQVVVTTTPRPLSILRAMCKDPMVHVTTGSTFDNARNLAKATIRKLSQLIGTDQADQELFGIVLDLSKGALWQQSQIELLYVGSEENPAPTSFQKVVIIADPGEEIGPDNDATGILVVGHGWDDIAYVLEQHTGKHTPKEWTDIVLHRAAAYENSVVIVETNKGGLHISECLSAACVRRQMQTGRAWAPPVESVKAIGSKGARSGPTSILYQQGKFRHWGRFDTLEEEMTTFVPGIKPVKSPNTLDCLNVAAAYIFNTTEGLDGLATMTFKPVGL